MTYRDPYVAKDGPVARLAAKILKYDGSLPSATFTPRERWKAGQTSSAATPSEHMAVHRDTAVTVSSTTDFCNHSKRSGSPLFLSITLDDVTIRERVGYPHMQPSCKRDQRHLLLSYTKPIPETLLQSMIGRPIRDLVEMPAWLDEVFGWRRLLYLTSSDPVLFIVDHKDWDKDVEPR